MSTDNNEVTSGGGGRVEVKEGIRGDKWQRRKNWDNCNKITMKNYLIKIN